MNAGTVVWYNTDNRFALIKQNQGGRSFLVQISHKQASSSPLQEGQQINLVCLLAKADRSSRPH